MKLNEILMRQRQVRVVFDRRERGYFYHDGRSWVGPWITRDCAVLEAVGKREGVRK